MLLGASFVAGDCEDLCEFGTEELQWLDSRIEVGKRPARCAIPGDSFAGIFTVGDGGFYI